MFTVYYNKIRICRLCISSISYLTGEVHVAYDVRRYFFDFFLDFSVDLYVDQALIIGSGTFRRRRFGAGYFGAGHFGAGTIGRQNIFFRFLFL